MRIGVALSRADFQYDLHALVQSFYPDDELTLFTEGEREADAFDLLIPVEVPVYTDRSAAKNRIKLKLYRELSARTGQELPWGVLSGIRPVRLPMAAIRSGKTTEEAARMLETDYLVSKEKALLAARIAQKELAVTQGLVPDGPSMSLYIHIPFCPTICAYCSFTSRSEAAWKKLGARYLETLKADLRESACIARERMAGPLSVYIGGGTPTVLSADQLESLLEEIGRHFDLGGCREFTVEAGRPDSITEDKLAVLKVHGVSRISINPQTMNDPTLERIGRRHSAADVRRAFALARAAGFSNINMDMILGLPGEGRPEVERTLDEIEALAPESLTVHALALKRASRIRGEIREDRLRDLEADRGDFRGLLFENSGELQNLVYSRAAKMGMEPYYLYRQKNMRGNLENTGLSLPGKECLYNIVMMEELQSVLSAGAGAISKRVYGDGRIERCDAVKDPELYMNQSEEMLARKRRLFS